MTEKVRFIHAADMHLGSILSVACEGMPHHMEERFQDAVFEAYRRICKAAIDYKVNFLVLSGDVYEGEMRSVKADQVFVEQCQELEKQGISVFVIAGNHDPLNSRIGGQYYVLPGNVYYFDSEEVKVEEIQDEESHLIARILGQSYRTKAESRKMYSSYTPPDADVPNIGLLHSQLDPNNRSYVPCSLGDLLSKKDIHYWALGHIHKCRILNEQNPVVAYPGIPQGRDFGEEKVGGCLLVDLYASDKIELSFLPTSPLIWYRIEVDIGADPANSPGNLEDVKNLIIKAGEEFLSREMDIPEGLSVPAEWTSGIVEGYIVQWILCGRGEIHELLNEDEEVADNLTSELRRHFKDQQPFIWTDSVVVRTLPDLPALSAFKNMSGIGQEIENVLQSEEFRDRVQKEFGDIWEMKIDHENVNEIKFQVDEETYAEILNQAVNLIIEKTLERGEGA
ncbi:MAG: DNA repair exonuclease [Bacillota bacterium]|nr:DNA repair exonuclease [Bacillota bacterium]